MPYKSSLSDEEWKMLEPLLSEILPPKKQTRPANWSKREILDGIRDQLKNGCNWQDLPLDLPTQLSIGTCWQWRETGATLETNECPTWASTGTGEKKAKYSTLIIIDSQVVKYTCNAGVESKGFCKYKATNGAKSSGGSFPQRASH